MTGGSTAQPLIASSFRETNPKLSPDGRFIAYVSDESGREEVYVKPFPKGDGRWLVSVNGGTLPHWNARGGELFYAEGNTLMAVAVETAAGFRWKQPHVLFDGDKAGVWLYSFNSNTSTFDVMPDAQRFVVLRSVGGARSSMTVVQNWATEFAH